MGIPGVGEVHPGLHVCALFSGTLERDLLLVSFMQEGLRHGDQCVFLIDGLGSGTMRQRVTGTTASDSARRNIDFFSAPDTYIRTREPAPAQSTPFPVDDGSSVVGAFPLLRAAGQMSRGPIESGAKNVFLHETAVIRILSELPAVFLCMYDIELLDAGTLAGVLKIHSMVMVDGTVLQNPLSLAPVYDPGMEADDDPAHPSAPSRTRTVDGGDRWRSLTNAEDRVARLVGNGMTNRATALQLTVSTHTVDTHMKHIYQKLGIHTRAELAVFAFRHFPSSA
ncbi:hypothetical protein GCM10027029_12430 [Conyzicola lurida]|nr:MEDS domain-containing protein [Conyzicola lurida]